MSLKMYFLATALLIVEVSSQLAGFPCGCSCGGAMRPTGPIIPACTFVLPAVVKPVLPSPRAPPAQPCLDFDDENPDELIVALITSFLDSKNPGSKTGRKGKSYDFDDYDCEEFISPSLYRPPVGCAGAGAGASYADCESPKISLLIKPSPTSQDV